MHIFRLYTVLSFIHICLYIPEKLHLKDIALLNQVSSVISLEVFGKPV